MKHKTSKREKHKLKYPHHPHQPHPPHHLKPHPPTGKNSRINSI